MSEIKYKYIRGAVLPNYEAYCPITEVGVYEQEDGSYILSDGGHPIDSNNFLIYPAKNGQSKMRGSDKNRLHIVSGFDTD